MLKRFAIFTAIGALGACARTSWVTKTGRRARKSSKRKLAGLPAEILGLEDRGTLAEGNFADIVVFDPETIEGVATFEDPFHYSVGMQYVFVNGVAVVSEGEYTGELPGRALRGPAYQTSTEHEN